MCRLALLVGTAILASSSIVRAQADIAAGIDAFIRGDYNVAAEILKPIAERILERDYSAEFFMASLYETGRGVPVDLVRACALYRRSVGGGVFQDQAILLSEAIRKTLSAEDGKTCLLLADIDLNHRFQAVTVLEPGHWISWDLGGATITYAGSDTRINRPTALPTVFRPLEHTDLRVGPSRSGRRHFIEILGWTPAAENPSAWSLDWTLVEVVRDSLVDVTTEQLTTVTGLERPVDLTFDVRKFVRLDVSDKGDAELHVLAGRNPRTVLIESDDERQEAKRQELARQAAEARVDWKSVRDAHRAPSLSYVGANGCGNVFVYGWTASRSEALTVSANQELLQLSTTPRTFDVSAEEQALQIMVHVYERPHGSWSFCSDVWMAHENEETWKAIRGVVTLRAWRVAARVNTPASLRVMVRIDNAEFVSPSGTRVVLQQPIILNATIPWLIG